MTVNSFNRENKLQLLALDFDGVVCDGLIEYFQVAWRTYCQIWLPTIDTPPDGLAEKFFPLRAVVETGWEMPVLIKALVEGVPAENIFQQWSTINQEIIQKYNLNASDIGGKLDKLRDDWIANDLDGWLSLHRFYPGVIQKITAILKSEVKLYIITTKEGRFVEQLLQKEDINLPREFIFGKEVKRPKYEILRELIKLHNISPDSVFFIEDRLKTLQLVQKQPDLTQVKLFLADWGYNTQSERDTASNDPGIQLISLSELGVMS